MGEGKTGLVLMGGAMLSKSLIQFSVDGWSCVPSLLFTWGQTMLEVMKKMNSMKRQNDRILKEELPRSVGAQYATGDQWRNNSRKNKGMEPKQKQYPVVDVSGDRSKV